MKCLICGTPASVGCDCAPVHPPTPEEPTLPTRETVLADRSASNWLKAALRSSEQRDCVDALNDADLLFEILKREADEVAASQRSKV